MSASASEFFHGRRMRRALIVPLVILSAIAIGPIQAGDVLPTSGGSPTDTFEDIAGGADKIVFFTYHTRRNQHPLGGINVASAHDQLTSGQNPRWAMINNGTDPITEGRQHQIINNESPHQRVIWHLTTGDEANRPAYAVSATMSDRGGDYFATAGNPANAISIDVISYTGARVATLSRPGQTYDARASRHWNRSDHRALIARLEGTHSIMPPSGSMNAGGHCVIRLSDLKLKEVTILSPPTGTHGNTMTHRARASDQDERNITSLCSFQWARRWGNYWQPDEWADEDLGAGQIRRDENRLNQQWHMGNPQGAFIDAAYFGPHYKPETTLRVQASMANQTVTREQTVSIAKGRIQSSGRVIVPRNDERTELESSEVDVLVPATSHIVEADKNTPRLRETVPLTRTAQYVWHLDNVMSGFTAGLALAQNPLAAVVGLAFNVVTRSTLKEMEWRGESYRIDKAPFPNPFPMTVQYQWGMTAQKQTARTPTHERISYRNGLIESAESGEKTETREVKLREQAVFHDLNGNRLTVPVASN